MSSVPLWIAERVVEELLSLGEAIDVLAEVHCRYQAGDASNMVRTHGRAGEAILHAVGGIVGDISGTKTWMHTPGGAEPLLVLFSPSDGSVQAVIEAFAMGQMRTAATSALGTRLLARPEAATLAVLGTGKQALPQVQAAAAVRPIERVRVFGRDAARRVAFCESVADLLGVDVSAHGDPAAAMKGADVVALVTRAVEPFVTGEMLAEGLHLNAVGAIVPSRREVTADAVASFDVIAVDSLAQARVDSGELLAAESAGRSPWDRTRELGELLAGGVDRRPHERTLLKALGVGIADVALGAELLRRAQERAMGSPLPRTLVSTT